MTRRALFAALTFALVVPAQAQVKDELPSSKEEISNALAALRDRYGLDAVRLESFLLQYAIEAGSVLTASVAMRGVEEIDGHTYLQVDFDTGIIYAESSVPRLQAPARIWSDVVDPTLRQFNSMQIAAEGIVLHIHFRRSEEDIMEVLRERRQDSLPSDVVSFRMLCRDIVDSVRSDRTSVQLLDRAVVLLNEHPTTLHLGATAAKRSPRAPVTPPLPLE
jgi:hypothetical protein